MGAPVSSINGVFRITSRNLVTKDVVNFLIDTGASISVLPRKQFQPDQGSLKTLDKNLITAYQKYSNSTVVKFYILHCVAQITDGASLLQMYRNPY